MPCGIEIASTIELTFFSVSVLQKMIVEEMQDWNQVNLSNFYGPGDGTK